jgi:hypothetical protein
VGIRVSLDVPVVTPLGDQPVQGVYYIGLYIVIGVFVYGYPCRGMGTNVFCKRKFPIFAKIFPQAPVGNFYVNLTAS